MSLLQDNLSTIKAAEYERRLALKWKAWIFNSNCSHGNVQMQSALAIIRKLITLLQHTLRPLLTLQVSMRLLY